MSYALTTIWHERARFIPAILAVAFSCLLIALQAGLLLGLLSMMSTPVDRSTADVWVGFPGVRSVDLGQPIPEAWAARLAQQPEIVHVEPAMLGFGLWTKPARAGGDCLTEAVMIVGTRLHPQSIGAVEPLRLRPDLLARLAEPGAVVIDDSECGRLGVQAEGDRAEVFGVGVRVVGFVTGLKSLGGPYLFCSIETARTLLKFMLPESVIYHIGKCANAADAPQVTARLRQYVGMTTLTHDEMSHRTRLHWLFTTKAGIALGFAALLGLLVGAVVTSQTLYAATVAAQREYATLRAMGIPSWRLQLSVLTQSLWVGLAGISLAVPITFGLAELANRLGTQVLLPWWILLPSAGITLSMALIAGLAALRSFSKVDPAHNIR
jgi:putative ABC transport system permease protein